MLVIFFIFKTSKKKIARKKDIKRTSIPFLALFDEIYISQLPISFTVYWFQIHKPLRWPDGIPAYQTRLGLTRYTAKSMSPCLTAQRIYLYRLGQTRWKRNYTGFIGLSRPDLFSSIAFLQCGGQAALYLRYVHTATYIIQTVCNSDQTAV